MPSGIIMQSASAGTDEANKAGIQKALEANGYEVEPPVTEETTSEPVEPKREDFKSDEEFETAQDDYETKLEDQEAEREAEEERKRLEALPKKSRRQRAVEKATADLRKEIAGLRKELADSGKKPAAKAEPVIEAPKQPKREDFKSDQEFEDALFDYRYKLRRAKEQSDERTNAMQEHQKENLRNYEEKREEFKATVDDWDETLKKFGDQQVSQTAYMTILSLEDGARVVYYLAKHPDKLEEINSLFPDAAVRELVRLHDKLKPAKTGDAGAETKPKPKPRVPLPEPVKPVSAAAPVSTMTSKDAAQRRDYRAFKAAQRAGR